MAIMLFWYQKERMEKTDDGRAMGIVIKELAQYLKKKHIPFCFPRTNSGKHREDWARVVYYQPPDPTLATQA
ncbi:hypothetical protein HYV84_04295 [Candidatus Woesearchaeota archaeon]|nr:hypothetical protein [Candidatus Woesearchaeota archaeon]